MNALGHATEPLYVPLRNPVVSLSALEGARLLARGMELDEPDRPSLALGSLLAAYALGSTGYAVHHVLCQSVVRALGTPHAETNAVLLPHVLRLMAPRAPEALGLLAVALGAAHADPERAAERAASLARRAGPTRLRDLGADPADLPRAAAAAAGRAELARTPDPPSRTELEALLAAAL
jgi:alcohol dehydrogenase class IV